MATYYVRAHTHNEQRRFWTFNTGRRLIRNHGDVWNERVFNLIMAVLERRVETQNQNRNASQSTASAVAGKSR